MTTPPKKTAHEIRREQEENDKRMSELIAKQAEVPAKKRKSGRKRS